MQIIRVNAQERERTFAMAVMELRKRYVGAKLGYYWAIIRPAIFITVYWFAIAVGLRGSRVIGDVPYIFWLIPGIVPWFFMADAMNIGGSSIRSGKRLVTQMVYPVQTIPTFTVLSLYLAHLALAAVALIFFLASGAGLTLHVIQLPYYLLCAFALAMAISSVLSTLTVLSRDVEHITKSVVQFLFWMSPILWSADGLASPLRQVILANPIAYITDGYRNAFLGRAWFYEQWEWALYFWAVVLVLSLLGAYLYDKMRGDFADVL
jgi:ABC-type polysaccharide/polyol phosphate export permease